MKQYCVVRGKDSGVFVGYVVAQTGQEVTIVEARRIYHWDGATETLQLALEGIKHPENSQVTVTVPELVLTDVSTLLPCSEEMETSYREMAVWKV